MKFFNNNRIGLYSLKKGSTEMLNNSKGILDDMHSLTESSNKIAESIQGINKEIGKFKV